MKLTEHGDVALPLISVTFWQVPCKITKCPHLYLYVFAFLSVRLWWSFFKKSTTIDSVETQFRLWIFEFWFVITVNIAKVIAVSNHLILMVVFMVPWLRGWKSCFYFTDVGNHFSSESLRKSFYKSMYPIARMVWLSLFSVSQCFFPIPVYLLQRSLKHENEIT